MSTGKRLTRSMSDRWLAGVCSGIANYFVIYIILWICMPEDNN